MLARIPYVFAPWTSTLAASIQLPQGNELLLKGTVSPEDMERGEEGSGLAVGTQLEVPGLTVMGCDLEPAPLGLSLPTWTANRTDSHTF